MEGHLTDVEKMTLIEIALLLHARNVNNNFSFPL